MLHGFFKVCKIPVMYDVLLLIYMYPTVVSHKERRNLYFVVGSVGPHVRDSYSCTSNYPNGQNKDKGKLDYFSLVFPPSKIWKLNKSRS